MLLRQVHRQAVSEHRLHSLGASHRQGHHIAFVANSPRAQRTLRWEHKSMQLSAQSEESASSSSDSMAVVIVDHGSRKKDANDMLINFAKLYMQISKASIVEIAHMELAEPTIEQALGRCAARGAKTVVVAPYFLSRGRHIQEDIPSLVKEAQEKHAGIKCIVADPIGIDPLMAQLIENRVQAALKQHASAVAQ